MSLEICCAKKWHDGHFRNFLPRTNGTDDAPLEGRERFQNNADIAAKMALRHVKGNRVEVDRTVYEIKRMKGAKVSWLKKMKT